MNEIIKSLYERKSMRVYEDRPIPEEMKQVILEAAAQAPTAGCQQLYTILDITDQKLKEALVDTCDHQPFIAKAPLVLIFCADCKKWYDAFWEYVPYVKTIDYSRMNATNAKLQGYANYCQPFFWNTWVEE